MSSKTTRTYHAGSVQERTPVSDQEDINAPPRKPTTMQDMLNNMSPEQLEEYYFGVTYEKAQHHITKGNLAALKLDLDELVGSDWIAGNKDQAVPPPGFIRDDTGLVRKRMIMDDFWASEPMKYVESRIEYWEKQVAKFGEQFSTTDRNQVAANTIKDQAYKYKTALVSLERFQAQWEKLDAEIHPVE
jgi:hypothetical protein